MKNKSLIISFIILALTTICYSLSIQEISELIIKKIEKYDKSGKGAIPKQQYGDFLAQIYIQGTLATMGQDQQLQSIQLIKEATKQFAELKSAKQIGIQDFYMDLIKDFTVFVEKKPQYLPILKFYFGQKPKSGQTHEVEVNYAKTDL